MQIHPRNQVKRLCNLALLLFLAVSLLPNLGCKVPDPDVTTVWQQLGFPQGRERIRDNFRNRTGDRPDREWKEPLKRITDKANLESPSDLLKGAAEIKLEQDLIPQKVKALKFLAGVACGCEEEKVEKAIIAGLNDCSPEVRREALNVVLTSAGGASPCKNKQRKRLIKRRPCGKCAGQGCGGCAGQGCEEVACEVAVPCQSCGACCGRAVQKKLEEMAYKQKDNGCWHEPVDELRAMAANALGLCPPLPPGSKPDVDNGGDNKIPDDSKGNSGKQLPQDSGSNSDRGSVPDELKKTDGPGPADQTGRYNSYYKVGYQRNGVRRASDVLGPPPSRNLVPALVNAVSRDGSRLQFKMEQPYAFPVGSSVIVSRPNGLQIDLKITKSGEGVFNAEPNANDRKVVFDFLQPETACWIGVLGN